MSTLEQRLYACIGVFGSIAAIVQTYMLCRSNKQVPNGKTITINRKLFIGVFILFCISIIVGLYAVLSAELPDPIANWGGRPPYELYMGIKAKALTKFRPMKMALIVRAFNSSVQYLYDPAIETSLTFSIRDEPMTIGLKATPKLFEKLAHNNGALEMFLVIIPPQVETYQIHTLHDVESLGGELVSIKYIVIHPVLISP
jgi:hypothetical protein